MNDSEEIVEQGIVSGLLNGSASSSQQKQPIPLKKLSKEDVQRLVETLERMKAQGLDKSDARYLTLLRILKAQSLYGHTLAPTPGFRPAPNAGGPANSSTAVGINSAMADKGILKVGPGGITSYQLFQLKAQILAYKYLSRNLALPPKLLSAIRTFSMKALQQQQQQQQHAQLMKQQLQQQQALTQQQQQILQQHKQPLPIKSTGLLPQPTIGSPLKTPINGGSNLARPSIGTPQQSALTKPQIPGEVNTKPDNLSIPFIHQEREKRIKTKMQQRLEELNSLSAELDPELKRRALIEMKQLKLVDLQKKLRGDIANRMRKTAELEAAYYANVYSRAKKVSGRQSKSSAADHLPPNYRGDSDFMKNHAKHLEFVNSVLKHSKEFKDWHLNKQKRHKKLQKDIMAHYTNEQKRQQAEEERKQRERLQALRNQDEEGYRKLLEETKHHRLATLLKQTDEYLEKIGALVQGQKDKDDIEEMKEMKEKLKQRKGTGRGRKKAEDKEKEEGGDNMDTENEPKEEKKEESVAEKNKKYYTMAHTIEEKVTEQPEMVVGGKLKSYQLVGLQWLVSLYNNRLNGILADEMGLGKTIQTIALIAYLMEKKSNNGPYLVVVPLSTISNWALEFSKWAPGIVSVIYKGKPQNRKQIYRDEIAGGMFNVCLTSYEYVMIDKSDLGKMEWNYIIIDEGHRIKNKNSKLSTILRQYMSRHRLLLTGTPLQNDLTELWSLLNFLLPSIFNSADNFEQWFNAPFAYANKNKSKPETTMSLNEEETMLIINRLHKVLRPFLLRRLKQDVESELPDKVETVLKCDLSALQRRMYKNMVERGVMLQDPNAKGRTQKGFNNTLMQLQKICNHPYLFKDEYTINQDIVRASGKFDLIDRILPKLHIAGHRILIFNQMTHLMSIMEDYFQLRGYDYLRLDGSTKSEDRSEMVAQWNAPDSPYWLFILSTKAGGLGLNLQTADTVIIFDTDWNPQADLQAQDRAHRIGQQKEVRIFRLISHNSVEEKILEKATFKLDVDAKVIQAGMFNTHSNDKMRRAMLESLLHEETDDREMELCTNDEQINSLLARTDQEYELYQQMDKQRALQEEEDAQRYGRSILPRLVQDDELPDYLLNNPVEEDVTLSFGRGMRVRPEVVYDDGLSENQFAKLVERGEIDVTKRRTKVNYVGSDDDEEPEDADADDAPDDFIPMKKEEKPEKKERKDKRKDKKRKSRNMSDDDGPTPKKKRGPKPKLSTTHAKKYDKVWNIVAKATDKDGRQLSTIFMKLPSKKEYPDYYQLIKSPICLKAIKSNFKKYKSVEDFKNDFATLFKNAKTYNQEGSPVYNDADALEKIFYSEYEKEFANSVESNGIEEDSFDIKDESSKDSEAQDVEVTED